MKSKQAIPGLLKTCDVGEATSDAVPVSTADATCHRTTSGL